jgi:type VI secretion system protein ImpJ
MQQLDLYHERLLHARLQALAPWLWGVRRLHIDESALASGELSIDILEAVLPGGTPITIDSERDEVIPTRPFVRHLRSTRALEIFIGLPIEREGLENCNDDGPALARFSRVERRVVDLTRGRKSASVAFARRNLRIIFGDETREDFECIKVAEVITGDGGAPTLRHEYIPPALDIRASSYLIDMTRDLVRTIAARGRDLASALAQRDRASVTFEAADVTRYLFLCALNTHLPTLQSLIAAAASAPPRALYTELLRFAGHLSTFSTGDPLTAEEAPFDHNNLGATFVGLFARVHELLGASIRLRCVMVPFDRGEHGEYNASLADPRFFDGVRFVLAARSRSQELARFTEKSMHLIKLAASSEIARIRALNVAGLSFKPTQQLAGIPVRPDTIYVEIEASGNRWRQVRKDRNIALSLPSAHRDEGAEFELYAVLSAERRPT